MNSAIDRLWYPYPPCMIHNGLFYLTPHTVELSLLPPYLSDITSRIKHQTHRGIRISEEDSVRPIDWYKFQDDSAHIHQIRVH